ncbi:hypothetical protein ACSNOI_08810 [Actinomadura kijaniata]|uniref:hypothetical protein n=1 Tax=Actinomadura kijaniata TaxID=46161 RepID=UPI003F1D903F
MISHAERLRSLMALAVVLQKLGAETRVGSRTPGLEVIVTRTNGKKAGTFVAVDDLRGFFWWKEPHHHPIDDVPGAARALLVFLHDDAAYLGGS